MAAIGTYPAPILTDSSRTTPQVPVAVSLLHHPLQIQWVIGDGALGQGRIRGGLVMGEYLIPSSP